MLTIDPQQLDAWIAGFFWPFVRILALIATAPVIGHRAVPVRVKVGLAFLASVVIAPTVSNATQYPLASAAGMVVLVEQIIIGVALGFTLRVILAAVELAGEVIGAQVGLNFAGFFDPQSAQGGTAVGAWLGLLMTLVFLAMNGHLLLLYGVGESFTVFPIGLTGISATDGRKVALLGAELFRIGVYAALPVIAAMLLCNVALGVLARIAPQVNLLAVGFAVTLLVGFAVLILALPAMGAFLEAAINRGFELMLLR